MKETFFKETQKEITNLDTVTVDVESVNAYHLKRIERNLERYGICRIYLHSSKAQDEVLVNLASKIGKVRDVQNDYNGEVKTISPRPGGRQNSGDSQSGLPFHTDGPQDTIPPSFLLFKYQRNAKSGGEGTFLDMRKVLKEYIARYGLDDLLNLAKEESVQFYKEGVSYVGKVLSVNSDNRISVRTRFHIDGLYFLCKKAKRSWEKLIKLAKEVEHIENVPNPNEIIIFDNHRYTHGRTDILDTDGERAHSRIWVDSLSNKEFGPRSGIDVDHKVLTSVVIGENISKFTKIVS